MELIRRKSFRNSKTSYKKVIEGREFFITQTKANKNVIEIYDTSTGILLKCSTTNIEDCEDWCKRRIDDINNRLAKYEDTTPNLFNLG